jgi:predicted permease
LNRYDDARSYALYQRLLERLGAVAGVRSVAVSNVQLLSGSVNSTSLFVQGRTYAPGQRGDSINRLVISAGFFETMGMSMRVGRAFSDHDTTQQAPKIAIVNETAARKLFPNESPIGQHVGSSVETAGQAEIVGVLRDAKYDSVRDPVPPTMYVPYIQARLPSAVFHVRTAGDPAGALGAIREAVRQTDPLLPVTGVTTQTEQVDKRLTQERAFAQAYTLFGVLALLLASVGLFGLMSYSVVRRTNEIGIRMALGAQRADVLRLVMRESMILVVVGVAIGLVAAIGASRLVATLLYGLAATDAGTMIGAMLVLVAVSAVAGYLPARRAARVDPLVALHYE